jgi:MFS transporter, DHA1 family, multidrug resistance protein
MVSFAVSVFDSKSAVPMAAIMAVSACIAFTVLLIGRRLIVNKVEASSQVVVGH